MLGTRLSNIIVLKTYILTFEGISNFSSQYELLVVHISFLSVGTSLNRIDKNSTTAYIYVHFSMIILIDFHQELQPLWI